MIKTVILTVITIILLVMWWLTTLRTNKPKQKSNLTAPRGAHTIIDVLFKMANKYPSHPALMTRRDGGWRPITYHNYYQSCCTFARGLRMLDAKMGDRVGIIGFNAPGWMISHLGCFTMGAVSVGIYPTNQAEACQYVMEHSKIKVLVVENEKQLDKFKPTKYLKAVISYSDTIDKKDYPVKIYGWNEFMTLAHTSVESGWHHDIRPDDRATFIYTSGTTGNPKGAMITHKNILSSLIAVSDTFTDADSSAFMDEGKERFISYLPLNHIAAQMFDIYVAITSAATVYFADPDAMKGSLLTTLTDVHPTVFIGVPRVWEKMSEKIQKQLNGSGWMKDKILSFANWWCPDLINQQIMCKVGLDKCKYRITAAAPISHQARKFFTDIGYPLCDLYGMSETTGLMTISLPETQRDGSVGKALPGLELKIENDEDEGEIMVRGEPVFSGYFKQPDKTEEVMTGDGWMKTGDVGKIDSDGYLYITGRSKDIIITKGGENVTPTLIEESIKTHLPIVEHAIVVGDQRKFLTALLVLKTTVDDGEPTNILLPEAKEVAKVNTLEEAQGSTLLDKWIEERMDKVNKDAVSSAQTIKKWRVMSEPFSLKRGHLTPTMKLKRGWVYQKYTDEIESMYSD